MWHMIFPHYCGILQEEKSRMVACDHATVYATFGDLCCTMIVPSFFVESFCRFGNNHYLCKRYDKMIVVLWV